MNFSRKDVFQMDDRIKRGNLSYWSSCSRVNTYQYHRPLYQIETTTLAMGFSRNQFIVNYIQNMCPAIVTTQYLNHQGFQPIGYPLILCCRAKRLIQSHLLSYILINILIFFTITNKGWDFSYIISVECNTYLLLDVC